MGPLHQELAERLTSPLVVVGVGNPGRGDDAAGIRVARALRFLLRRSGIHAIAAAIPAGTTPEAVAHQIVVHQPQTVLLVDAVAMGAEPGAMALLDPDQLNQRVGWSVHRPSLSLLMQYLTMRTGARTLLLGIQAGQTDWGAPLTPAVRQAAREAACQLYRWGVDHHA